MENLKSHFLLDPEIIFLNHGSFGACPRPVFEVYQNWQLQLERQPVLFLGRQFNELMLAARQALGKYLNAPASDLVFVPNATHAVNIVLKSLNLQPGDEILTSDHEYGACIYTLEFVCLKTGALIVRQPVPFPAPEAAELIEEFWKGVTPRTRLIFLSQITSPTALELPVAEICARARQSGILTLIDGAHAPGQIPLDIRALHPDFYTGNCHKWMLAPKGAAFLYTNPAVQPLLEPLVVSWGYHADASFCTGSQFVDYFQWTGTHDPAAALSVPAAIQYMEEHDWGRVRQVCQAQLAEALHEIARLSGIPPLYPLEKPGFAQMAACELPVQTDLADLKSWLYAEHKIEIPAIAWNGRAFLRISVQGYNSQADLAQLINALKQRITKTTPERQ